MVSVFATCPFCGGHTSLLSDETAAPDSDLIERFRGHRINCSHRDCAQPYAIRRENIKIRRAEE